MEKEMNYTKQEFDEFAQDYRSIHTQTIGEVSGVDSDYFSKYKIELIVEKNKDKAILDWLDLGCGDGNSAIFVKEFFPMCRYEGIDVSADSIDVAKQRKLEGCSFQTYDGKIIPYEDNKFDVVFLACVLHHIPRTEYSNLLKECRRVLKADGKIIIFEHNPVNPITQKIVKDCVFDRDAVLIKAGLLKRYLTEAGFIQPRIRYSIFFPRKSIFKRLVFLEKILEWCVLGGQYWIECKK